MRNNGNDTIKVETVAENDTSDDKMNAEEENMESLLASFGDDGEFMTQEEQEKAAAEERRRKRRRRLERLEASDVVDTSSAPATTVPVKKEAEISMSQLKQPPEDDHLRVMKAFHKQDEPKESQDDNESNNDSDSDESDMFASPSSEDRARKEEKKRKRSNDKHNKTNDTTQKNHDNSRQDGFDDSDGYYKASIGETMELEIVGARNQSMDQLENNKAWTLKLRVLGIIGKGVFSSVLKCSTTTTETTTLGDSDIPTTISINPNSNEQHGLPPEVAIKCIRSNETMAKAALDEMKFLIRLRDSPGVVPLLLPTGQSHNPNYVPPAIDYRNHTLLVFPYLPYNLRDVLQKFGKGVGLSLGAVQNYFKQLLNAAIHLQRKGVIHADIKPDNILVTPDFSRVLVADFGSAFEAEPILDDSKQTTSMGIAKGQAVANEAVTPYLVSRFYRAPEIILGLQPLTYAIDLWSLAVTAAELFLGSVLLKGANNNDMLYTMMKLVGPFSGRTIKSHLLQTKKHPLQAHFSQVQSNFVFRQETLDPISNLAVHKEIALTGSFQPTLQSKLLKAKSPKDTRTEILAFSDLLKSCLVLDPSKRSSVREALKHKFFVPQQQQKQQQSY